MPGFLYKEDPITTPVYSHPMQLMANAIMVREAKARENISLIRSQHDALINTPLTNESNRIGLRADTEAAIDRLKGLRTVDLSLAQNATNAMSVFDNVLNNKNYLTDIAFTKHVGKQKQIIDDIKKNHPEQWSKQNEWQIVKAENEYRFGDPGMNPNFSIYKPYVDVDKKIQEIAKSVEEEEWQQAGVQTIQGADNSVTKLGYTQDVKSKRASKISERVNALLAADPNFSEQLAINYEYLNDTGQMPYYASAKIKENRDYFQSIVTSPEGYSPDSIAQAKKIVEDSDFMLESIRQNPATASRYYNQGNFITDYVEDMSKAYSYNKVGGVEYDKASFELFKQKLDRENEAFKSKLRIQEKAAEGSPLGNSPYDPSSWSRNSFISGVNQLKVQGSTNAEKPFVEAILRGEESKTAPGYYELTNIVDPNNIDPTTQPLLSLPNVDISKDDIKNLNLKVTLENLEKDLNKVDKDLFRVKKEYLQGRSEIPYTRYEDFSEQEKFATLSTMLSGAPDKKFEKIVNKYKTILKNVGINTDDPAQLTKDLAAYEAYVSNPENASKITDGTVLSSFSGNFKFRPTGKITMGDNDRAYLEGFMMIPEAQLPKDVDKLTSVSYDIENVKEKPTDVRSRPYAVFKVQLPKQVDANSLVNQGLDYWDKVIGEQKIGRPFYRQQIEAYAQSNLPQVVSQNFKAVQDGGRTFYQIQPNSTYSAQLSTIMENANSLKNQGLLNFDSYYQIVTDASKLMARKFESPVNATIELQNYMKRWPNATSGVEQAQPVSYGNNRFGREIANEETPGAKNPYTAFNSAGGGEGAVGKYQFRWNKWKPDIQRVTGINTKEAFLNNPEAQEMFYNWYEQAIITPSISEVRQYDKKGLTDTQIAKLIHFRGKQGAIDYLTGKVPDKPESYNVSIPKYLD